MKKFIGILIFTVLLQFMAIAQPPPPAAPMILGVWYGRYTGYDPQTKSNITVTRRLIIREENRIYSDTLWGQPTELDSIIFELEIGNWDINPSADSINFTPTLSKRIDISNPDSLVEYDRGFHQQKVNNDNNVWPFHDDNMNVDYNMYKEEFINKPETPSGNTTPDINEECVYTTSSTTSNLDHDLEYSFNWSDGTSSNWSPDTSASHSWSTAGVKYVTVTARCQEHTSRINESDSLEVNVLEDVSGLPHNYETTSAYSFRLLQDHPGTLSSPVTISYFIPEHTRVILSVYNVNGQLVKSLISKPQNPGYYEIIWDGTDENGKNVKGGIYFFTFKAKDFYDIQKSLFIE